MTGQIQNENIARHGARHDRDLVATRGGRVMRASAPQGRPVIDGLAVTYGVDHPCPKTGTTERFAPGCFASAHRLPVKVLVQHDYDAQLSESGNDLALFEAPDGLAFRFTPPRTPQGSAAVGMVQSRNRPCVSVGYRVLRDRMDGDVRVIVEAELKEISLCRLGAVPGTFTTVVDGSTEPEPTASSRSPWFATMARVARPLHALALAERKALALAHAASEHRQTIAATGRWVDPDLEAAAARHFLAMSCRQ
jgi:HK97 family phage prohead protease